MISVMSCAEYRLPAETAWSITTQIAGEALEATKDIETRSYKEPPSMPYLLPTSSPTPVSAFGFIYGLVAFAGVTGGSVQLLHR